MVSSTSVVTKGVNHRGKELIHYYMESKRSSKIYSYLLSAWLGFLFLNVFMVDKELYDATRTGKWIFILSHLPILTLITVPVLISHIRKPLDCLFLLVLSFALWSSFVGRPGGIWHDVRFFYWSAGVVFFFIARCILIFDKNNSIQLSSLWLLILVIAGIGIGEAVIGYLNG